MGPGACSGFPARPRLCLPCQAASLTLRSLMMKIRTWSLALRPRKAKSSLGEKADLSALPRGVGGPGIPGGGAR